MWDENLYPAHRFSSALAELAKTNLRHMVLWKEKKKSFFFLSLINNCVLGMQIPHSKTLTYICMMCFWYSATYACVEWTALQGRVGDVQFTKWPNATFKKTPSNLQPLILGLCAQQWKNKVSTQYLCCSCCLIKLWENSKIWAAHKSGFFHCR